MRQFLSEIWTETKEMFAPVFTKRSRVGWVLFVLAGVFFVSDRLDSINSLVGRVSRMGDTIKFIVDVTRNPAVQATLFFVGVLWIGIAAIIAGRRKDQERERPMLAGELTAKLIKGAKPAEPKADRKPGITVSYDGNSLDCMWPVTFRAKNDKATWKGIIARLRVDSETESGISECKAAITSLKKNAKPVIAGVQLPMLFTPAHDAGSDTKVIKYGQPEYLELLWIPESGEPQIMTNFPNAFSECKTLDRQSAYSLYIAFSVDNTITEIIVNTEYRSNAWKLSIIRSAVGKA